MKIKLLYPPQLHAHDKEFYLLEPCLVPSISLPVLSSFLRRKGHKISQDDLDIKLYYKARKKINMFLFDNKEKIKEFIKKGIDEELEKEAEKALKLTKWKAFDIVGISVMDEWNFASIGISLVMAKIIKETTGAITSVGGVGSSAFLRWFTKEEILKYVDIFCPRPSVGHLDFYDVLLSMEKEEKNNNEIKTFKDTYDRKIENVMFNNKLIKNFFPYHEHNNTTMEDIIPTPDFDDLPIELYRCIPKDIKENGLSHKKILVLPYYFTIGCPNQCIFCATRTGRCHIKHPQKIADDLEFLSKKYKTRFFIFFNSNVNPTSLIVEELINAIKKKELDLIWSDCACFKHLNTKLIKGLRDLGARRLILGVESPSPRMLKYIEKETSLIHIERMLKLSDRLGIWNEIELIAGLPHETENDVNNTIKFLQRNRKLINFVYLHKFKLHFSKLTQNPEKYKITNIRDTNLSPGKAFDEIGGLNWNEKIKEIDNSYRMIKTKIDKFPNFGYSGKDKDVIKLFYLYSIFDDKKEIVDYLKSNPFSRG